MNEQTQNQGVDSKPRVGIHKWGSSLGVRLIVLIVSITLFASLLLGLFAYIRTGNIVAYLTAQLQQVVRGQAEQQLNTILSQEAQIADQFFVNVTKLVASTASTEGALLSQGSLLGTGDYWDAQQKLTRFPEGFWGNSENDLASVLVPSKAELNEYAILELNSSMHLDFSIPASLAANPTVVAMYYINPNGIVVYYPNINLATIVGDYDPTGENFYTIATPENNIEGKPVWTAPYQDPALTGLLVTNSAPVFDEADEFRGVIGADVQLGTLTSQISEVRVAQTGFAFLVDSVGHVIAMPEYGYEAFQLSFEEVPVGETPKQTIFDAGLETIKGVAESMTSGEKGLEVVSIGGLEHYFVFTPLESVGFSLGIVVPVDEMNAPFLAVQNRISKDTAATQVQLLGIFVVIVIAAFVASLFIGRMLVSPLESLTQAAQRIATGDLNVEAKVRSSDEIGALAKTFNSMTKQIRELIGTLEQRVAERTKALETSAEVSQRLSTLLDQQELVTAVVEDVQRAFNYYHVHIYLMDEIGENLVMAGGTGEAGQAMLRRGHSIPAGKGLVGRAAEMKEAILVSDTSKDPSWLPNPLLPDTRSEAAVPITIGDRALGVLDVQHNVVDGLTWQDVDLLQLIANQVAVALQNANQYQRTQEAVQNLEQSQERLFTVLDIGRMATWEFDLGSQTFTWNDQFYRVVHTTAEEVGGYTMSAEEYLARFVHPEDAGAIVGAIQQAFQETDPGFRGRVEYRLIRGDGELQYALAEYRLELDERGNAFKAYGFHMDVTDRKRAELDLAKRALELATVAKVGTAATTILEPEELLQSVVDLTKSDFDLYHAHIYLLNESGDALELAAGAGEIGRQMVAQGWRILLNSERSLVARAARGRQGVISNDVRAEPDFLPNELLPDIAAEMAIPLIAGDQLLGVLDVQSDKIGYFTPDDVATQTTLASQIAIALQNARQYQQTRQSEQLTRTIIDATPDWIFIKDREHRYRLVNQGYANSLQIGLDDFMGKDDLELGFPEEIVKGDPARGIRGFWPDDDEVMESGQIKIVPSEPAILDGEQHWLSTVKVPLKDEQGKAWGVLGFVRDITDRERLRRQTEERLAEIDALYRTMSRESWKAFHERKGGEIAFYFDREAIQPAGKRWIDETQRAMVEGKRIYAPNERPVLAEPLALRGDVIGALAIETDAQHPLSDDELNLLDQLSEQIALALESARLFEQTQYALGETETLYGIIAEMNAADSYEDILNALAGRTMLVGAGTILMGIFDRPMTASQSPEWIFPVALRGGEAIEIAPKYPVTAFEPNPNTLFTNEPIALSDLSSDKRLDSVTRMLFREVFLAESSVIIPLRLGEQSIGFIQGFYSQQTDIPQSEVQRLVAVAGQAAIAVQSRLLLEQAQARARQEQRIREVTSQVFEAADVDTIMRRAVEQVGRALGLPAYIYLGSDGPQGGESPEQKVDSEVMR